MQRIECTLSNALQWQSPYHGGIRCRRRADFRISDPFGRLTQRGHIAHFQLIRLICEFAGYFEFELYFRWLIESFGRE